MDEELDDSLDDDDTLGDEEPEPDGDDYEYSVGAAQMAGIGAAMAAAPRATPKVDRKEQLSGERKLMQRQFPEAPTIADLKKHAEKYGTDHVLETAAACGYGFDTLVQFCETLDLVDAQHAREKKFNAQRRRPKGSAEKRVQALLGIEKDTAKEEEGGTMAAADMTDVSKVTKRIGSTRFALKKATEAGNKERIKALKAKLASEIALRDQLKTAAA